MIHVHLQFDYVEYDAGNIMYLLAYVMEESFGVGPSRAHEYEVAVATEEWEAIGQIQNIQNAFLKNNAAYKKTHKTIGGIIVDMDDETEDVLVSNTWRIQK